MKRSPDGTIRSYKEKRKTGAYGKTKTIEVFEARKRYRCEYCERCQTSAEFYHEKKRRCFSHPDAVAELHRLRIEIERETRAARKEHYQAADPSNVSFFELLDYYEREYVRPAEYAGNQKTGGFRENNNEMRRAIKIFRDHFGDRLLSEINYQDVRDLKQKRLNTPVEIKGAPVRQRQVATVHRELSRLKRIFNVAVQRGWIEINPFARGDSLISQAQETERTRICTADEETRLLAACTDEREHLRPIIVCALDSAMRRGEILQLKWSQIDFDRRLIRLPSLSTKTLKSRIVPVSTRLQNELEYIRPFSRSELVFPYKDIKKSFQKARSIAGCTDLRFHDLRGTAITRMLEAGLSATQVMKISGHTVYRTFSRYIKQDEEAAATGADLIDNWLETKSPGATPGAMKKATRLKVA